MQVPQYKLGSISSSIGSPVTSELCGNGRDLFFAKYANGALSVYGVDTAAGQIAPTLVASGTVQAGQGNFFAPLVYGRGNELLALVPPYLASVDLVSGLVSSLGAVPATIASPPLLAYNEWSNKAVVSWGDFFDATVYEADLGAGGLSWTAVARFPWYGVSGLASMAPRAFEVFGRGCVNGFGIEPRLGWAGQPIQGASFIVNVRNTEPSAFVAFWLGISDTFWAGVGNLPFDAGRLGAPGCTMYASAEDWFPALADANGYASVSFSVPVDPTLHGLEFFTQSASTSSANALGMAASDALVIRVR